MSAERRRPPLQVDRILGRLVAHSVDFVIIGGIAAVLHGSAQNTFDLDITYATDEANLAALGEALVELDARLKGVEEKVPFVPDGRTLRQPEILTMITAAGELDVLARPGGGPGYQALRTRAERFEIGDFSIHVASLDDLIAMKTAAGRPKDLAAIDELEAIKRLRP